MVTTTASRSLTMPWATPVISVAAGFAARGDRDPVVDELLDGSGRNRIARCQVKARVLVQLVELQLQGQPQPVALDFDQHAGGADGVGLGRGGGAEQEKEGDENHHEAAHGSSIDWSRSVNTH